MLCNERYKNDMSHFIRILQWLNILKKWLNLFFLTLSRKYVFSLKVSGVALNMAASYDHMLVFSIVNHRFIKYIFKTPFFCSVVGWLLWPLTFFLVSSVLHNWKNKINRVIKCISQVYSMYHKKNSKRSRAREKYINEGDIITISRFYCWYFKHSVQTITALSWK